jgi:hypothetical protein
MCERDLSVLTCGLNLNLTSGVMLIIFSGYLRPYVAVYLGVDTN